MKTYPYTTPDGIIELVRKDEHDKALELLREIRDDQVNAQDEADKFLRDHQPSELSKLRLELARWQSLAESLATALKDCKNRAMDKSIETHADDHAKGCMDDIWEWAESALAAYNSAKKGNLPDPLAEAVKRMEAVAVHELWEIYATHDSPAAYKCMGAVRARLISAAKGKQP